ncbi:MAG: hypothetical protein I3J02_05925 [Prevotella sp.]|nr:hypothetical protein [Prevotella sp.]
MVITIGLVVVGVIVASCKQDKESQLIDQVNSFSKAYFNWQFHRAVSLCTEESVQWLSYMASQVNQSDVDALRAMPEGATFEIGEVSYQEPDSTASVKVRVHHYLSMDTLGKAGRPTEQADFVVPVVFRHGRWKVNLSSPLRAEKD